MDQNQFADLKSILERQAIALENNSKNYEKAVQAQEKVSNLYRKNIQIGVVIAIFALVLVIFTVCLSAIFPNLFNNRNNFNLRNRMMGLQNSFLATVSTTTLRG